MNHNGLARYSLSTVMRSYFFEHEVERGQVEVKFVNGTCGLFQRCCEPDICLTVSARRGLAGVRDQQLDSAAIQRPRPCSKYEALEAKTKTPSS
jgi:hypothetical protein